MFKKTKVIATIGPASADKKLIAALIDKGVNLFRFNLKHNTLDWHKKYIEVTRQTAKEKDRIIGIIADTPKIEKIKELDDFDFAALSYVKTADEVLALKAVWPDLNNTHKVIAKIENSEAIKNLLTITDTADGIMIARGDLGIDIPIEQIAYWQKKIIEICRFKNVPVIVATQMLKSMTESITPTRAEATDVANAVYDGADALMLSEETAMGKHPVETADKMTSIIKFCEENGSITPGIKQFLEPDELLLDSAAKMISTEERLNNIVVFTQSGRTARILSSYRFKRPIVAITNSLKTLSHLNLSYGIAPFYFEFKEDIFSFNHPVFEILSKQGLIKKGLCLVVHGNNWLKTGSTSNLSIIEVH